MDANELPIVKRLNDPLAYLSPTIVREGMEAAALIVKLYEALKPFGKEASVWEGYADEEILVEPFPDLPGVAALTVGDLRRARAVLKETEGDTE